MAGMGPGFIPVATVVGLGYFLVPVAAHADTSTQFDVTATVAPGCLVDGLGASGNAGQFGVLNFGSATSFSTATRTATTTTGQAIRLRCTPGVALSMTIDGGAHSGPGVRNLQRGASTAARIPYTLCRDAACTQPITIGTPTGVTVTSANTEDVRLPIYGSLTLPGTLPSGTYTDSLTITLTW